MADTTSNAGTVVGYFETQDKAERAISALISEGFTPDEIGMATRGGSPGAKSTTGSTAGTATQAAASKAGELGHEAGAHAESAWGKVKSFFGGDPVEPYADEQTEGEFASREVTPDNYQHDDVHGSLEGITGSGEHAKYFGGRLQQGNEGVVVTVTAQDRAKTEKAERILEQNGADLGRSRENFAGAATTGAADLTGEQNIRLYGEVLRVHKDRVSRGEVRLRKETHTDMQTIQVPVTREELVIERVAANGQSINTDTSDAFSDKEIRIPLSEEHASVDKQAVLREEVHVGKREVAGTESFNESVRSEELKVEDGTTDTRNTTESLKR